MIFYIVLVLISAVRLFVDVRGAAAAAAAAVVVLFLNHESVVLSDIRYMYEYIRMAGVIPCFLAFRASVLACLPSYLLARSFAFSEE